MMGKVKKVCEWRKGSYNDFSGCGYQLCYSIEKLYFGNLGIKKLKQPRLVFCPFCGKAIKEIK